MSAISRRGRPLHSGGSGGSPTATRTRCRRGCSRRRPTTTCCCSSTRTCTRSGIRGDLGHLLRPPAEVGAELVRTDRGGDVTYHGPGQLVGYPILTVPGKRGGGLADTTAYVCSVEQLVIDVLADLGLTDAGRVPGFPGVWVAPESDAPRKICAVGVKLVARPVDARLRAQRRSRHGDVRPHRPVRHRRQGRDVAAPPRASTSRCARSSTRVAGAGRRAVGERRPRPGRRRLAPHARRPVAVQPRRGSGHDRSTDVGAGARDAERHDRTASRPAGRGRRHRGPRHQQPQARVDAGAAAAHRRRHRHPQDDARPRPRHRVRGGGLPEPVRVLGRRHRHVHDQRRALHPGLRLLPRRHPPPAAHRPDGARAGGRGRRAHGPAVRRRHGGGPRRPARRRRRRVRRRDPGHPGPHARRVGRGADPRLQGRPRRARRRLRASAPTCSTTTSRRSLASSGRSARRPATPARWRCSPGPRRPASPPSRRSSSAWARRPTRWSRRSPTWPASASTSSPSASTCAPPRNHLPVARWWTPDELTALKHRRRGHGHRPRRGRPAGPQQLPRPPGRRRGVRPGLGSGLGTEE